LLKRYTTRIDLALDADSAGEEAIRRGIAAAESMDFDVGVIQIELGKDPDEAVHKNPDLFKKNIKKSVPVYDFIIDFFRKKYPDDDPYEKKKVAENTVPFLADIRNPIIQSYAVKKLANYLGVETRDIERLIRKYYGQRSKSNMIPALKVAHTGIKRSEMMQKYILSLIFQEESNYVLAEKIFSILIKEDFSLLSYQKIIDSYFDYKKESPNSFQVNEFSRQLSSELRPVFDEIFLYASVDSDFKPEFCNKLAYEIKKLSLKQKMKETMSTVDDSQEKEKKLTLLNSQLKEVEKTISEL
jgi:DNA primase